MGTWALETLEELGHLKDIWALKALRHLRHSGTWRAVWGNSRALWGHLKGTRALERHLGTWALRQLGTHTLKAFEALYLADSLFCPCISGVNGIVFLRIFCSISSFYPCYINVYLYFGASEHSSKCCKIPERNEIKSKIIFNGLM